MVEGSQWRILQLWLFLTLPSSQTNRLERSIILIESPFLGYPTCLILLKWFGGQRHCGRQAQQGGEDQGGR